ncbi:MAG: hypothetical protein HOO67_06095 [Candidatus Peribacteraceae bacterium]|nr:hypothetical protein [Candidatus Peribacteraceae bacterium]
MGVVTALLVAGAAVAAAGAAGSAYSKKSAADKAAVAQKNALKGQERILKDELSFDRINQAATDADELRANNRKQLQERVDPELAKLRQLGKERLLSEAQRPNESLESTQVAKTLFEENAQADPRLTALKDSIINRAQQELSAGASLPPEFQAELVRSGVEQGSQAGFRVDNRTVGGTIARALGIGGVQLQQQRQQEATRLAGAATNLQESRAGILASIFPSIKAAEEERRKNAITDFGIGDSTLPESGLSGREAAGIQQNRGNTLLKIRGERGKVSAQQALAAGEANASYIGAGTSFVTSALGAYGGGGGSGGGSGYGQILGMIGTGQGNANKA